MTVRYPTQLLTTVNQSVRIALPALNSRTPPSSTVTTTAAAVEGDEEIDVEATDIKLWAGERIRFGSTIAILAESINVGATTLMVEPLPAAVASGATATVYGTLYIAGATDASPSSQPKTTDATNFNSGVGSEMAIVGTSRTLSFTFNRIIGDAGGDALMQILFNDDHYNREVYAFVERENGEIYEGAAICTTGSQQGPVQEKISMNVNLQFQGQSFKFTPAANSITPVFV